MLADRDVDVDERMDAGSTFAAVRVLPLSCFSSVMGGGRILWKGGGAVVASFDTSK